VALNRTSRWLLVQGALLLGCHEGDQAVSVSTTTTTQAVLATAQLEAPAVPPLLPGEVPPTDEPNYFDARELGTGALVSYVACLQAFDEAAPDSSDEAVGAFCTCFSDAARKNVRAGQAPSPSKGQTDACFAYAEHPAGASPLSIGLSPTTERIAATFAACFDATSELHALDAIQHDAAVRYKGFLCSCITDAAAKNGKTDAGTFSLCDAGARYAAVTGSNLTPRQFGLLAHPPGRPPPMPSGSSFKYVVALPAGQFIAYPGNGGGPTPCADGMWSHSSGAGTCSGHGGVGGRRHRGRH
jgi:hypothetical protein